MKYNKPVKMILNIINKRKGMLLLQTLVLSVIMAMIGVMILKWVLARYILASRFYRSSVSRARVEGCLFKTISEWGKNLSDTPNAGNCQFGVSAKESSNNLVKITYSITDASKSPKEIKFEIDQDDYY